MPLFPPPQDDSLWQKMMQLVCEGDVAGLKAWVKAGGDVNQDFYDSFGEPRRLLTFAAIAAVRTGGNYTGHSGKRYVIDGIVQDV